MQIIRLIIIGLILLIAGCDSTRLAELESENIKLKEVVSEHNQETEFEMAKWELAASTYNGCISISGIGSFLCPDSAMIFGETAVTNGLAGAGLRYWLILVGKLTFILGVIGFITFAGWCFYVKQVMPDRLKIAESVRLVNEAESNVEIAKIEEIKLLASMVEINQEYINLKDLMDEANNEYQALLRKKQEIEIMSKAMKAFD